MTSISENNKRIAKNTFFLYFRMLFTMGVSLYTSRVILATLGIEDYGIYNIVGGVVGIISFIQMALANGSSRFLTYELGTGDFEKLKKTFSTTLNIHVGLAIIIAVIAETIGLWFIYQKLDIPPERMEAAVFAYHVSVITTMISIMQVPYNSIIIAHERMNIYAYISIVEVSVKLGIVYFLVIGTWDKLKLFSLLLLILSVFLSLFYRYYCIRNFKESKYSFSFDKTIFKPIIGFSSWSILGSISNMLVNQGITLLTAMFFNPFVIAARAIAVQVNGSIFQFVNSFRTAINPQIVKYYAAGEVEKSKQLILNSAKYSFYIMWILVLPLIMKCKTVMGLWLVDVPDYTVIFVQLILVQSLFSTFDISFYTQFYAMGRLRENALISPVVLISGFPVVYVLFKLGYSPVSLSYVYIIITAVLAVILKPILLCKLAGYKRNDFFPLIRDCIKITLLSLIVTLLLSLIPLQSELVSFLFVTFFSVLSTAIIIYWLGIDVEFRQQIKTYLINKLKIKI